MTLNEYREHGTATFRTVILDGVRVHTFAADATSGEVYDTTQVDDRIHDGDVLVVPRERIVGFLLQAWPCAITDAHGDLHALLPSFYEPGGDSEQYTETLRIARVLAKEA